MIAVVKPGLLTTVQDLGRPGFQQYGIVVGGALDGFSTRVANLILGNDDNAAVLEMAQTGPDLRFDQESLIAWCGADFDARIGNESLPRDRPVRIAAGETVSFGFARSGLRAWLAVAGGIEVPPVLGSRSTYRRAGIGGYHGRPLATGDILTAGKPGERSHELFTALHHQGKRATGWSVRPQTLGGAVVAGTMRAMPGPEWDWFTTESQQAFFSAEWQATREADRMGVRLQGPMLEMVKPRDMISSAVNTGIVQVPPAGQPIVLLPSRQSIGGYPRFAAVAAVDVGRFTQLRPGDTVRFQKINLSAAHEIHLARERELNLIRMGLARLTA